MFKIKKQLYNLLAISGLNSFQIAGASWVALLAARGFSMIEIGLAESCFHVASLLFEIPSGVISDVFGRKKSMILSQCMFILSAVCMIFSSDLVGVCIALILDAFGYNFASGAREALAYDSLKMCGHEERYMEYSSADLIIYRIGNAGAILSAGLALWIGYKKAYLLDAVLGIACLCASFQLEEIQLNPDSFTGSISIRILQCFRESFAFLTRNLRTLGLMLWNSLVGAIATLTVFFLQASLPLCGIPNTMLGPCLFIISLGGAVGARLVMKAAHWTYGHMSFICVTGILLGTLLGLSKLPLLMVAGGFLSGLNDDMLQVRTDAILNDRFHSAQRATLISLSSLCFSVVMILLSPAAGFIFSR